MNRTHAVAAALAAVACFPGGSEAQTSTSAPQFSCTFSNSPLNCGFTEQAKSLPRASIVNIGRDGSTAVQLRTEPGDNYVHGSGTSERNDLWISPHATACYQGSEAWWSHSVLFPSEFVVPSHGEGVVMSFHDTSNSGLYNFSVAATPHGLRLLGYGGPWPGAGKFEVSLGSLRKNQWYDFVYQVRWSSGSDGFFNAWVNGAQVLAHRGPTLYWGQGCYLKLQNLHPAFGQASSVIHDRVMRGATREAVQPSPVVAQPTSPSPTPTAPSPAPANPLDIGDGFATFYVEPDSTARREADRLRQQGSFTDAALLEKIAANPQGRWFGNWNWNVQADVQGYVGAATSAGRVPVLVAYNIPNRDCSGYSAGGASSADAYRTWIRAMAAGIAGRKALVVLEPDALAQATCLSSYERGVRYDLLKDAVAVLKASGALVYLDAGHAAWVADSDMAGRLKSAGLAQADGFALNVSNFHTTDTTAAYGERVSALTGGKRYVVDTSRNGRGSTSEWCNPRGRGLGARPTANTGKPLVDAYLWIKRPGESDGSCNGGPSAGQWWLEYALELARNAVF